MIKTLIYIDVFLIFLSLGSALYFLIVDQGKVESKRTANSLGFRVALATSGWGAGPRLAPAAPDLASWPPSST